MGSRKNIKASPGKTHQEFHNIYAFAALKNDGHVVTWGSPGDGGDSSAVTSELKNVNQIFCNQKAFAALKTDGSVISWGNSNSGGDQSSVASSLSDGVERIFSTVGAFAALKIDGSVITWGNSTYGGDSSSVSSSISSDIVNIFSNRESFAAIKSDGSVITWGDSGGGGDSSSVAYSLSRNVSKIFSSSGAFAALKTDGSVITWGYSDAADSSSVKTSLNNGVSKIYSTEEAFAALKSDGSVITWGDSGAGGNASLVASDLTGNVREIFSTEKAFAALKSDGSVITWGNNTDGGNSENVNSHLNSGVVNITSTDGAFAALKDDGSVITWGNPIYGADSSSVAPSLSSGVSQVFATELAFAALKNDGSVITWGNAAHGGDSHLVTSSISAEVESIYSTKSAFAALKKDGSIISWGHQDRGGDQSSVSTELSSSVVYLANPFTDDWLNEAPTALKLSSSIFNENTSANSTVATLSSSDPDSSDTHTYSLVSGSGDTDNNLFTIDGSSLKIKSSPDYETKSSYSIRLQTTDSGDNTYAKAFTLSVNDLNETPTAITLSSTSFNENISAGSTVATLSTTDEDSSDTHTYSFIEGTGDTDNNLFTIDGSSLKIKSSPDYETKSSYSIRLQTTDSGEKQSEEFSIGSISSDAPNGVSQLFSKETEVFGIKIYATSTTLDSDVKHAAKIMAEYLDNDENGVADDSAVITSMINSKATLVMFKDELEQDSSDLSVLASSGLNAQNLFGEETIPNGAASGQFDASLEEILHLITDYGYVKVYPTAFSLTTSLLTEAMDIARGGNFQTIPNSYPAGAWYTYYDETSDYATQATEYLYWGLTSILGGQSFTGRLDAIKNEWTLNTSAKVQSTDAKLYSLLTDTQYKLPTVLPNGEYSVPSQATFTKTFSVNDLNELSGTTGKDIVTSTTKNDYLNGGVGTDTFIYTSKFSNYSFTRGTDTLQIADQRTTGTTDGTDTLKNIEYIQFSDQTVEESKVDVIKTYSGNFSDYKFYNKGNGKYEIKTDSGYDDITGYPLLKFTGEATTSSFHEVSAIADIKGTFDQVTGLNTDSGRMFRLYNASFKRLPDADGLKYWIDQFSSGRNTIRVVASSFLGSAEFKQRYGEDVTDSTYVNTLYKNVLDRDADTSGLNYWLGQLNSGAETRYEVLLGFAESAENKALFTEMTGFG